MGSEIKCPVCGCEEVFAAKKGFNTKRAIAGAILTGDALISALAGGIGKDKIEITCLRCGHKFSPGDPLSINNKPIPTDTDKYLADKKDLPKMAYYKCPCGKISSLETSHPYCPSCGRHLTEEAMVSEDFAKEQSNKGGCFGVLLIPLLVIGSILLMI